ncbi:hypothetical protein B0H11DRAFT_2203518 [Mycena galericulata]|nr:hypothetical protein B0H11DRAFT_2203518 [Mycena galericulata]
MTSHEKMPEELWLEIFCRIPWDSLKDVSVTNHAFRRTCLSLLFADFHFHPYTLVYHNTPAAPPTTEIEVSLERLDFWCSDKIASLVRTCNLIALWSHRMRASPRTGTSPYILLTPFFDSLPSFTGICQLHAHGIHFTQTGLANLCRLPVLSDLHIDSCDLAAEESIDTATLELAVSSFSFSHKVTGEYRGVDWMPLLCLDHLRELEVEGAPCFFGDTVDAIPSFPHVHKLAINTSLSTMSHTLSIVSKFPAVQIFRLTAVKDGPGVRVDASKLLPDLKEYTATSETLPIFLAHSTLERLTVLPCQPQKFTRQVPGPQVYITCLHATFMDFDTATFRLICVLFPRLTELKIFMICVIYEDQLEGGINSKPHTLFSELAETPALPSSLVRLAISWYFGYNVSDEEELEVQKVHDFDAVRDALVAQCPALTRLWLDGHEFLFYWRKSLDGAEDQGYADDAEVAPVQAGFDAFWGMRGLRNYEQQYEPPT